MGKGTSSPWDGCPRATKKQPNHRKTNHRIQPTNLPTDQTTTLAKTTGPAHPRQPLDPCGERGACTLAGTVLPRYTVEGTPALDRPHGEGGTHKGG